MPEIGEVARVVHYLRKHLVDRTIKSCQGFEDDIVYGKVGCSASAFSKAVQGRKVMSADQQGKYFYLTFDRAPHAVMHLGMTGWIKFSTEDTAYYKQAKEKDKVEEEWPPKYMKFLLKCDADKGREAVEVAFVDPRRLARIRLVDIVAEDIRKASPLTENGPDPVRDKNIVTVEWLKQLLRRKRVPVKALLLDQANISGVGNWVADEVLYQARLHPEQYSNTFSDAQVKQLHDALIGVCTLAVETLADSKKFPEDWIMKYRWNKGKKDSNVLPNGEKIVHLTVGGRTSAIVPSRQRKTAAVAGDVNAADLEEGDDEDMDEKPAKEKKRKRKADEEAGGAAADTKPLKKGRGKALAKTNGVKHEDEEEQATAGAAEEEEWEETPRVRGKAKSTSRKKSEKPPAPASRRSTRTRAV